MLKTHSYKIFCKDYSNKKADFRVKVTLLASPKNRTKKEKKRALPLGS